MEDVERLLKSTVEELERLLSAKNVLGEPIEKNGSTVIPIVSYGFGFGAGGGTGNEGSKSGSGGGTGAGGGIKPLGAIIIDEHGARVEAVKGPVSNLAEILGDAATKVMNQRGKADDKAQS
ncbi:MAG: spore germination protein GerW family protein [Burkholderiaceae bacterium]